MFIHLLAAVTASTLAVAPVHAVGATPTAQPEPAAYAGTAPSRLIAATAGEALAGARTIRGCLADQHATVVFRKGAAPIVLRAREARDVADLASSGEVSGMPTLAVATPALTNDDCKAEFSAMFGAIDNYAEASGIFSISWLAGPGAAAIAGIHLYFRARAMIRAEANLDECLAGSI